MAANGPSTMAALSRQENGQAYFLPRFFTVMKIYGA
jgi:hypothetical protein